MGAPPVDPVAGLAAREVLLGAPCARLQPVEHLGLRHGLQHPAASGAPRVGGQRQPEPVEDVGELVVGAAAAHVGRAPQGTPSQQAAVLGQQQPVLTSRLLDQLVVVGVVAVRRVHPQQPQPATERTQVHVEQQPRRPAQRLRPRVRHDLDQLLRLRPPAHADRLAADPERADLRERDPGGLHDVAERGGGVSRHVHDTGPPPRRQQEPQLRRHAEPDHVAEIPVRGPAGRAAGGDPVARPQDTEVGEGGAEPPCGSVDVISLMISARSVRDGMPQSGS